MRKKRNPSKVELYKMNAQREYSSSFIYSKYPNVESICIDYKTDAIEGSGHMVRMRNDRAFFKVDCQFSYGFGSGFDLNEEVDKLIQNHISDSEEIVLSCGGFGDIGNQYHCDNRICFTVHIKYKNETEN